MQHLDAIDHSGGRLPVSKVRELERREGSSTVHAEAKDDSTAPRQRRLAAGL